MPSAWSQNVNKWCSCSLTVDSYVLLSYVLAHDDGRKSFPLCFIFISPQGLYNNDCYYHGIIFLRNDSGDGNKEVKNLHI